MIADDAGFIFSVLASIHIPLDEAGVGAEKEKPLLEESWMAVVTRETVVTREAVVTRETVMTKETVVTMVLVVIGCLG